MNLPTGSKRIRPVMQTKRGGADVPPEERGDCLDACLATLLHVAIDEVPVPHGDGDEYHWWDATQRALEPHGYHMVVADPSIYPHGLWLAGLPSKNLVREDGSREKHIIVMLDGEVAHDPCLGERYEAGTPIEDLDVLDAYALVPFDQSTRRAA